MNRFVGRLAAVTAVMLACMSPVRAQQISIKDPWVRGTVAGQKATGAFMSIIANADTRLVGARSPVAGIVEVHEMRMDNGVMRMRAVNTLPLAAGQALELKPGGYHVMLMDLKRPLAAGESVPITLMFENGAGVKSQVEANAPVRALAAPGAEASGRHTH